MSQAVKIPVVERKKVKIIRYAKWIVSIAVLIILLGIIIDNIIIILGSGLAIIAMVIFMSLTKTYSICGFAVFNNSHIKIYLSDNEGIFNLKDLTNLEIKYDGYKGEPYLNPKSIIPKDGTGNFISFFYCGKKLKYELLFERNHLKHLNNIISQWEKDKVNVTLIGEWGFKVKSL